MRVIDNRVVGENGVEHAVLWNYLEQILYSLYDADSVHGLSVGDAAEPGVMTAEVDWCHGSLGCEVWFEPEPFEGEPSDETWESGMFSTQLRWRTPEREGYSYELYDIVQPGPSYVEEGFEAIAPRDQKFFSIECGNGSGWIHTHGMEAKGLPELEMRDAPGFLVEAATELLWQVCDYMFETGTRVKAGETVKVSPETQIKFVEPEPLPGEEDHYEATRLQLVEHALTRVACHTLATSALR